jgi:hypothetical protein
VSSGLAISTPRVMISPTFMVAPPAHWLSNRIERAAQGAVPDAETASKVVIVAPLRQMEALAGLHRARRQDKSPIPLLSRRGKG